MSDTISWYKTKGYKLLNRELVELTGKNIGELPIINLEVVPYGMNMNELAVEINKDGGKTEIKDGYLYIRVL